jgi:hypothetical protein
MALIPYNYDIKTWANDNLQGMNAFKNMLDPESDANYY